MRRLPVLGPLLLAASLLPAQSIGSVRGGSSVDVQVRTVPGSTGASTTVTTTPARPTPPPELSLDWRERMRKAFAADDALRLRLHGLADADGDGKLGPNEETELEFLFRILFLAELAGRSTPRPLPDRATDWPQRLRKACADDDALRLRLHKLADADGDGALTPTEEARMVFLFRCHAEAAPAPAAPKPAPPKEPPATPQDRPRSDVQPKAPGRSPGKGE